MQSISLDDTDRQILDLLQEDSSITNVELARRVGLAPATTFERVKKLEQRGILKHYVALIDPEMVGQGTMAFVSISLSSHQGDEVQKFRDSVAKLPEVLACYHTAGAYDYLLKVVAPDIRRYEEFLLKKLTATPNLGRVHTSFVLSTVKDETKIPLSET